MEIDEEARASRDLVVRFHDLLGQHFQDQPAFDAWIDLWHDDGVYEQAFPASGQPVLHTGKEAIGAFVHPMSKVFRDFSFSDLVVNATDDRELMMATTRSAGVVIATGRQYDQEYLWLFRIRQGRVAHWRAYLNPLVVLRAFAA